MTNGQFEYREPCCAANSAADRLQVISFIFQQNYEQYGMFDTQNNWGRMAGGHF